VAVEDQKINLAKMVARVAVAGEVMGILLVVAQEHQVKEITAELMAVLLALMRQAEAVVGVQ
jgi:hypothetical protein